jgi:osmotically inducible lipoprotein OsmB
MPAKERIMMDKLAKSLVVMLVLTTLAGCAGMTAREKNTAIGAAVGGVAGSVLTNGSGVGTVGGAAVGGIIGNQIKR